MLRIALLIMISSVLFGFTSCNDKIDAFRCVSLKADNGSIYLRCRNPKTAESFNAGLDSIGKCIRATNQECTWILTDEVEYEIYKKNYEKRCVNGNTY
jgi:hypothetical protein